MASERLYMDDCIDDINNRLSSMFEEMYQKGVQKGVEVLHGNGTIPTTINEEEAELIALFRSCSRDDKDVILYEAQSRSQQNVIYLERQDFKIVVKGGTKRGVLNG